MISTRAADRDGQARLAFALEARNGQVEEAGQEVEELLGDGLAHDIVAHGRGEAGQMPELVDVVRVLHEADVEDQVRLQRHAVLEPEADQLEDDPDVG